MGQREVYTKSWSKNLREREHVLNDVADGIILNGVSKG
jgi:hypothetical protein